MGGPILHLSAEKRNNKSSNHGLRMEIRLSAYQNGIMVSDEYDMIISEKYSFTGSSPHFKRVSLGPL